jgi:hypothetical protein
VAGDPSGTHRAGELKSSGGPIPAPDAPPPRRSDRPFPARRHVPVPGATHPSREGFVPTADFAWACDLYDHRFYWEAHEVWEAEWAPLRRASPDALFLQGLICSAASVVKHHQGFPDGARRLLDRARGAWSAAMPALPAVVRGVDFEAHAAAVEVFLDGGPWPRLGGRG